MYMATAVKGLTMVFCFLPLFCRHAAMVGKGLIQTKMLCYSAWVNQWWCLYCFYTGNHIGVTHHLINSMHTECNYFRNLHRFWPISCELHFFCTAMSAKSVIRSWLAVVAMDLTWLLCATSNHKQKVCENGNSCRGSDFFCPLSSNFSQRMMGMKMASSMNCRHQGLGTT